MARGPNPSELLATVSREQWQRYQDFFTPIEDSLIADLNTPLDLSGVEQSVRDQSNTSVGVTNRTMNRYGVAMTPEQQAAYARQASLGLGADLAHAKNTARINEIDRKNELATGIVKVGKGISGSALGGLGSAAQNQAARNSANASIKAQNDAAMWSTVGTLGAALIFCSREFKQDIREFSEADAVNAIQNTAIKRFRYKDGIGIEGEFIGPMAEDAPKDFVHVSGQMVELSNMVGALVKTNQQLLRRVDELEMLLGAFKDGK